MHEDGLLPVARHLVAGRLDGLQQPGMHVPNARIQNRYAIGIPVGHQIERVLIGKLIAVLRGSDALPVSGRGGI